MAIGVSSGMMAVMVLAFYVNAPEATLLYQHKLWLWLLPTVRLYWISRIWMKAHRGEVDDDPVVFAARDWQSQVIVRSLCCAVVAGELIDAIQDEAPMSSVPTQPMDSRLTATTAGAGMTAWIRTLGTLLFVAGLIERLLPLFDLRTGCSGCTCRKTAI